MILLRNRTWKRNNAHIGKREYSKLKNRNKRIFNNNDNLNKLFNNNDNLNLLLTFVK
jgi:hypothetical protein